jgi:glycosyltransferase involved in cell wall biosynthesis
MLLEEVRSNPSSSQALRKPFVVKRFGRAEVASPEIALLVSTYQKPWHLTHMLQSIVRQRGPSGLFEVVVTDDGSTDETHRIVGEFADSVRFPVALTWHDHVAFQLARCRNEGVAASRAPYLLFLDGDCVLPPDHVVQHLRHRRPGRVMCGYCIRLDQETSARFDEGAIASGKYVRWPTRRQMRAISKRDWKSRFYQLIRHPSKPKLTGGNCGIWREDFERVNGFDENFEGWGGEDTDLGQRLRRAGSRIESILRWTYSYHLWHPPDATAPRRIRDGVNHQYLVHQPRLTKCVNGLVRRRPGEIAVSLVGKCEPPERVRAFLQSSQSDLPMRSHNGEGGRPEIELLFLPGKGSFTGGADCKVLIVLEDCPAAQRLAGKADLVVANRCYRGAPAEHSFPLSEFRGALSRIAGTVC